VGRTSPETCLRSILLSDMVTCYTKILDSSCSNSDRPISPFLMITIRQLLMLSHLVVSTLGSLTWKKPRPVSALSKYVADNWGSFHLGAIGHLVSRNYADEAYLMICHKFPQNARLSAIVTGEIPVPGIYFSLRRICMLNFTQKIMMTRCHKFCHPSAQ
jgi:hypothetical protein